MKSNILALTLLAGLFIVNTSESLAEERIQDATSTSGRQSGKILIDRKTHEDSITALSTLNQTHAYAMDILKDVEGNDLLTRVHNVVNLQVPTLKEQHASALRDKQLQYVTLELRATRSDLDSVKTDLAGAKAELNNLRVQLASVTSANSQLQEILSKVMAERDDFERKYLSEHQQLMHVVATQQSVQTQQPQTQQVQDVNANAQIAPQVENTQN